MMEHLDSDHEEWPIMWQQLAKESINKGNQLCFYLGHCWEYLGSTADHHNFRHQLHPRTLKTEYIYLERGRPGVDWA